MLRTCNLVRIASVPVLRKDGALRRDGGRGKGGFQTRPYEMVQIALLSRKKLN
ncbi:MAG: hypothetical protein LBM98_09780 [Oscillospiraceae bacterium]|nr:hypothetical protein [Oscillospiraceae bacterium]